MHKLLLAFLLTAIALPVLAQGAVTEDPNASTTAITAKSDLETETDARLLQKITISESRKTVSAILADLSESTGIIFKAGYNNNDWQVRDRKMCVFAKDIPLVQIMNSISHVMKFKWERKGEDGKWQYRLYMDRRTLLDADSQKLREDERVRDKANEARKAALEDYANVDNLSPEEMAVLKDKDPLLYFFATTGIAGSLGQMFNEVPMLSDAMVNGQLITVAGADMSERGRAQMSRLLGGIAHLAKIMGQGKPGIFDGIDPSTMAITLNRDMDYQTGGMPQSIILASINVYMNEGGQACFPLMNPDSAIGRALGNAFIKLSDSNNQVDADKAGDMINSEVQKAMPQDMQAMSKEYGEPEIQHPDDSALKTKVKLTLDGNRFADIQKALSEASSYAVVSDSFGKEEHTGFYSFVKDENELDTVLDKLSQKLLYNWDKRASVLEFRDREWFRKRSAQIPESTLESWRQAFIKTGTLDLPDLAEISRLDAVQFEMNIGEDEVLGNTELRSLMWLRRDLLRLYAILTGNQRNLAASETGLNFQTLSPDQYSIAQQILKNHNVKYLQNPDAQITLKITSKQEDKSINYTFNIATSDNIPPLKFELKTPKYQEPKPLDKPKEKAKPADSTNSK